MTQWALRTSTGGALAQMAARRAAGSGTLANEVRERQDLEHRWQAADRSLSGALGRGEGKHAELARSEMASLDERIKALDGRLARDFPDYAALVNPKPLSIAATQGLLDSDEALVAFLETPEIPGVPTEAFGWAVTKTSVRWVKLSASPKDIAEHVAALRCGLDAAAWRGAGETRCQQATGTTFTLADAVSGQPLPFDEARGRALYAALLGPVADLIAAKHLMIVPSGALTSLPFGVLLPDEGVPPRLRAMATASAPSH